MIAHRLLSLQDLSWQKGYLKLIEEGLLSERLKKSKNSQATINGAMIVKSNSHLLWFCTILRARSFGINPG